MNKAFDVAYMVFMVLLLVFLSLEAYVGIEEALWRQRCKDAGGVPASHVVCINPGAVIEVE